MDQFDLYELCVTNPTWTCRFLHAVHGRNPRVLREDFSGSGALCRAWVTETKRGRAIAVDRDAEPLAKLRGVAGVEACRADVMRVRRTADVIAATNFPLGYFHTRPVLMKYLRHARRALRPRGVFVCDTYGGSDAFTPLKARRRLRGPAGEWIEYTWEQRRADPITARVLDTLSFRVTPRGGRAKIFRDAFVYDWRLWSIAELREAMLEAGFTRVEVYQELGRAIDDRGRLYPSAVQAGDELNKDYVVLVVGSR